MSRVEELRELLAVETDDCVLWPGGTRRGGYGLVSIGGRRVSVHRIALSVHVGPPPFAKAEAAHLCRTPCCLNYRHLRWASRSENEHDKRLHGAIASPLGVEDVAEIKRLCMERSKTQAEIARRFGVSKSTVGMIASGRNWAWVNPLEATP